MERLFTDELAALDPREVFAADPEPENDDPCGDDWDLDNDFNDDEDEEEDEVDD